MALLLLGKSQQDPHWIRQHLMVPLMKIFKQNVPQASSDGEANARLIWALNTLGLVRLRIYGVEAKLHQFLHILKFSLCTIVQKLIPGLKTVVLISVKQSKTLQRDQ